ncbi:MAG: endonuclease [Patescibacteria group bacterium]
MEGPSLFLAQEQLKPFRKKIVRAASGNTNAIEPESLVGKEVKDIFAWGKHLVFQFDTFAIRIHFMLFGTFEAEVGGVWVTGDYRRAREARLAFIFPNGRINMYNCSVKVVESMHAKSEYDYAIDIMSDDWDPARAYRAVRKHESQEIGDVLLDQEIFAGVGNIIKNEVLSRMKVSPVRKIADIPPAKLKAIIKDTRAYSLLFYEWRKVFELRKHLLVHRRGTCPYCGGKLTRAKTGTRARWSYWCPIDQI